MHFFRTHWVEQTVAECIFKKENDYLIYYGGAGLVRNLVGHLAESRIIPKWPLLSLLVKDDWLNCKFFGNETYLFFGFQSPVNRPNFIRMVKSLIDLWFPINSFAFTMYSTPCTFASVQLTIFTRLVFQVLFDTRLSFRELLCRLFYRLISIAGLSIDCCTAYLIARLDI